MLSLIRHLGASVFRVMSHLLKEFAHSGGKQNKKKNTMQVDRHLWSEENVGIFFFKDVGICIQLDCNQKKQSEKNYAVGPS